MPASDDYEWELLTLRERITYASWGVYHWFDWRVRGVRCLLTRHDVCWGDSYTDEPDWCTRCWRSEPNEECTLWNLAHNSYVWLIEHWKGFERFADWLWESKFRRWLPSWWEY